MTVALCDASSWNVTAGGARAAPPASAAGGGTSGPARRGGPRSPARRRAALAEVGGDRLPVDPGARRDDPELRRGHRRPAELARVRPAPSTSRPRSDSTPAMRANAPGTSSHTTVTISVRRRRRCAPRAGSPSSPAFGVRERRPRRPRPAASPPPRHVRTRVDEIGDQLAFHVPHADGPVASESASVRACSRSSSPTSPTASATRADRRRVVEVATDRHVGQQQVVLDHRRPASSTSRAAKPEPGTDLAHQRHAGHRCGRPGSPCRCRAAGRRAPAGRAGRPGRRARRRWRPSPRGAGRR